MLTNLPENGDFVDWVRSELMKAEDAHLPYESPPFDPNGDIYSDEELDALRMDSRAYVQKRTLKTPRMLAAEERIRIARAEWLLDIEERRRRLDALQRDSSDSTQDDI